MLTHYLFLARIINIILIAQGTQFKNIDFYKAKMYNGRVTDVA